MKYKKAKLAIAICCLGGLASTNLGWAALDIKVTVADGVSGLTSSAYDGGTLLYSTTFAGAWNAEITGGSVGGNYNLGDKWLAFCTDIGNSMSSGTTYQYDPSMFSAGDPPANNPPDPEWAYIGAGQFASKIYQNNIGVVDTAIERSAMTIAIWEALYEGGTLLTDFNVTTQHPVAGTSRSFQVTSTSADGNSAITLANAWLAAAFGSMGPAYTWFAEADTRNPQSLLGPENPVPEPSTYIAGALLLLPFFASTVRGLGRKRA